MGSVYKLTNTLNGMVYIGATHRDPEKTRKRAHLNTQTQGNRKVREAVAEYGKDVFTFEILHVDVPDEHLKALEREEIKKHNCVFPNGYNLTDENGSPCDESRRKHAEGNAGSVFSDEHKRKMSEAQKGENNPMYGKSLPEEHRRKISRSKKGKLPSDEHRRKLSEAHTGKTHSEESRRKMSEAKLGMSQEAFTILVRWLLRDGWSQRKIARELGKSQSTIAKYAKQGIQ